MAKSHIWFNSVKTNASTCMSCGVDKTPQNVKEPCPGWNGDPVPAARPPANAPATEALRPELELS